MRVGRVLAGVALIVVVGAPACGLAGGGSEATGSTDWTVARQSAPDPSLPPLETTPTGSEDVLDRTTTSLPPAASALSAEDRRSISVCTAVSEVQSAGMAFWEAYNSDSGGLTAASSRLIAAYSRLSEVAGPETGAALQPVLIEMSRVSSAPDRGSMRQAAGEVINGAGSNITAVLSELQPLCPGQLKPEDLDQGERVTLDDAPPVD